MEARERGLRDPWQDDALEGLVAYLRAARSAQSTAWAVVVSSSPELSGQLLEELAERVDGLAAVDLSIEADPRHVIEAQFSRADADGPRVTAFHGWEQILAADAGKDLLTWMNFHREDFDRAAGAFIFVLPADRARDWSRTAPDLDRYTQHFEVVDLGDQVRAASQAATKSPLEVFSLAEALHRAEQRLERTRALHEQEINALVEIGRLQTMLGQFQRAKVTLEEALTRVNALIAERSGSSYSTAQVRKVRQDVVKANAALLSHLGQPHLALRNLEGCDDDVNVESVGDEIAVEYFNAGRANHALVGLLALTGSIERSPIHARNIATIAAWLGQTQMAIEALHNARDDFQPWKMLVQAWVHGSIASLLVDTGRSAEALVPLLRSWRWSLATGSDQARVAAVTTLGQCTMDNGRASECLELLRSAPESPGWQTARSYGLAIVRAEASWVIGGPRAVLPIVREERERQRGWDAPIPAAELAYVRALASVEDDEAHRYLQAAADRFRDMSGWYYLSELERRLARLDRLHGDLDRAASRVEEGLEWHVREGLRPRQARDQTELAMIALGRADPQTARNSANRALELIRECGTRLHEPAALVALEAAERALGHPDTATAHGRRWRRLVTGIHAQGLLSALERDAAWARTATRR